MGLETVLEMSEMTIPERVILGSQKEGLTVSDAIGRSRRVATALRTRGVESVAYVGVNGVELPQIAYGAILAGVSFAPLNYRLSLAQLAELVQQLPSPLLVADARYASELARLVEVEVIEPKDLIERSQVLEPLVDDPVRDDAIALILFTSGTTSKPKGVALSHRHLSSYLFNTVEFVSADEKDSTLISTPAYHIAGMGALLSNFYAGRRMNYLSAFTPEDWVDLVSRDGITNVMLVPTMLARIVDHLAVNPVELSRLRTIAYGGAKMPLPLIEKALDLLPDIDFVNAYGLTETSSTIALLGPEDHREALEDPAKRVRLTSVGRPVPGVEVNIRDEFGNEVPEDTEGILWVRGPQVSGKYINSAGGTTEDGWFITGDRARLREGYLYIEGRSDDMIIRGGENVSPAEIEDVLHELPSVEEAAIIGLPDEEWGELICAVLVVKAGAQLSEDDVIEHCRARLRGSKTPDAVVFSEELPRTHTGKLLRRDLKAMFSGTRK